MDGWTDGVLSLSIQLSGVKINLWLGRKTPVIGKTPWKIRHLTGWISVVVAKGRYARRFGLCPGGNLKCYGPSVAMHNDKHLRGPETERE